MADSSDFVRILSCFNCGRRIAEKPRTCPMLRLARKQDSRTKY